MKKLLIATALLAATTLANAADMAKPIPFNPPALDTWSWSGFYIGSMAGYGWGNSTNTIATGDVSVDATSHDSGGLFGAYAGYNYQFSSWVVGLETDLAWANLRGSVDAGGHFDTPTGSVPWAASVNNRLKWLGTTRGRIGYAWGQFMPYVTGGLAYGGTQVDAIGVLGASSVNSNLAQSFSAKQTRLGWTVGAGVEYALGPTLLRLEYLHYDLGSSKYTVIPVGDEADEPAVTLSTRHKGDTVRVGLGFKF